MDDRMSANHTDIAAAKKALRVTTIAKRDAIPADQRQQRSATTASEADALSLLAGPGAVFSAYAAMGSEIDPNPLIGELISLGHTICLPVMIKLGKPLVFRHWQPGDPMESKKWGIREPLPSAPKADPDVLLLPMVAFDRNGWRLGYGGGFYDRTLARLRAMKPVIAIGFAFDEQEVDAAPHAAYDERLDLILTPTGLHSFQAADPS